MKSPYVILGVAPTATRDEIRRAYRKLVDIEHPDRHGNSAASNARMRKINAAFDALKTADARARTDAALNAVTAPAPPKLGDFTKTVMRAAVEQRASAAVGLPLALGALAFEALLVFLVARFGRAAS